MNRHSLVVLLLVAITGPALAQPADRQGVRREIDRLRAENAVLRQELRTIKAIVDRVQTKLEARQAVLAGPGLKIGVVDLGRVFAVYKHKEIYDPQINAAREEMKSRLELSYAKLKELREVFQKLTPAERGAKITEFDKRQAELDRKHRAVQEEVSAALKARVESMALARLKEIEGVIQEYSKRHGYDLVLKSDSTSDAAPKDALWRNQVDAILYRSPATDLTEEVIQALDVPAAIGFEPGPNSLIVRVLEDAEASYRGVRRGADLRLECELPGGSFNEAERLAVFLKGKRLAAYYGELQKSSVWTNPNARLGFTLTLTKWRGAGARTFGSLDQAIKHDATGTLGPFVSKLRAKGFTVRGRIASELFLLIRGDVDKLRTLRRSVGTEGRLSRLNLRSVVLERGGADGVGRLELTFSGFSLEGEGASRTKPKRRAIHVPITDLEVEGRLGRIAIRWTIPARNEFVVITGLVVERSEGESGSWQLITTLPPQATGCTHEVNTPDKSFRYRVVTVAEIDRGSPRVRMLKLELPAGSRRATSVASPLVKSLPFVYLIPLAVGQGNNGKDWAFVQIHKYDPTTDAFLPARAFRVEAGNEIGAELKVGHTTLDYRTGAVVVSSRSEQIKGKLGQSVEIGITKVRWSDGREVEVRSDATPPSLKDR
ncbi:MAG: OmpH family outer membrane protein [Planctomycetes bacterium]|nr:OmpH family outer membrane protein [Planctomycetota bacterium]